jgi:ADP-heptose:LPS heptosyltransferase
LLREVQATYPGAEIDIVTRSAIADDLYGTFFNVRDIHRLPAHGVGHPLKFLGILRKIRNTTYDLAIDPCPDSQTGRLLLLYAGARNTLGFASARKIGTLTHGVGVPASPRQVGQLPVFLLRRALGRAEAQPFPPLDIALTAIERQQGTDALFALLAGQHTARSKRGVIGVFANATGPKLLPEDWWQGFLREFEARHPDHAIVEIVPAFGKSLLGERYPAYFSGDVRKLASVLSALSLFVSADCGVMHLACASTVPVAGIFTVTDAEEWGPYGPNDLIVQAQDQAPELVAQRIAQHYADSLA